jgi:hypothetical protein
MVPEIQVPEYRRGWWEKSGFVVYYEKLWEVDL